jgi:hypothetical protein
VPEQIGLPARHGPSVSLEQGAGPDAARCPADGEPLFVWLETIGYGAREDQVIDRCENCGLAVGRDFVPSPDEAADAFLAAGDQRGARVAIRAENAASLQAWLGAENWAALRPSMKRVATDAAPSRLGIKPTPRAARLLLARRGLEARRVRHLARAGMASMWQTLLNLLTFHRDFASEVVSGRLRPGTGRGLAAFATDAVITVLAAIPTAVIAVLLEGGAVMARRGGVIEVEAERLPSTD